MPTHPHHAAGMPIWTDLMTAGVEEIRPLCAALFGWTWVWPRWTVTRSRRSCPDWTDGGSA